MNSFQSSWFYWAIGVAFGFPVVLILLTELHHTLVRRNSHLARQVSLLRNYLLPLGALLLLLVKASQVSAGQGSVRILTTMFGLAGAGAAAVRPERHRVRGRARRELAQTTADDLHRRHPLRS